MRLVGFGDFNGILAILDRGVGIPEIFTVTERSVEDPAGTVFLAPGDGVMPGCAGLGMLVEDEKVMDFGSVVIGELVDLLLRDIPGGWQASGRGIGGILIQALHGHLAAVMFKFAAQHVDVAGPAVEGVAGGVDADEGMAGLDPVEKALFIGNGQVAGGAGKD